MTIRVSKSRLVRMWEANVEDYVRIVASTRDDGSLIVGTASGGVQVLDANSGAARASWSAHEPDLLALALHPMENWVATGGSDGRLRLWNLLGELLGEYETGSAWVEHVAWAPSGSSVALAAGRRLSILNAKAELQAQSSLRTSTVSGLSWSVNPEELWSSEMGSIRRWNTENLTELACFSSPGSLIGIAVQPSGRTVACPAQDRTVRYFRTANSHLGTLPETNYRPCPLCWSPSGHCLAQGGSEQVLLWDFDTSIPETNSDDRAPRATVLDFHLARVSALDFASGFEFLASGSVDGSLAVWELASGRRLATGLTSAEITTLRWLSKGRILCASTSSGVIVMSRLESPA